MVLTKAELIAALQKEVRILVHLAGKVDARSLDYRPTPKQRSTIELLRYLITMGPFLTRAIISGQFDGRAWGAEAEAAKDLSLADTIAAIAAQAEAYPALLSDVSDDDLRGDVEMFGTKASRGASLVSLVICGYAAYRTQLFCYLKACGHDELNTMNLWAGMDAPARRERGVAVRRASSTPTNWALGHRPWAIARQPSALAVRRKAFELAFGAVDFRQRL